MSTPKSIGIHIFRRDLRLEDNAALHALAHVVDTILPVFIFDDRQVGEHAYRSTPGLQMLCESLTDLDRALVEKGSALHVRSGIAEAVLEKLIAEVKPIVLSYNKDYTPFAVARDQAIDNVCAQHNVQVIARHDATLHAPGTVVTKEGKPYSVYTHYRVALETLPLPTPTKLSPSVSFGIHTHGQDLEKIVKQLVRDPQTLRVQGGRTSAKESLKKLAHNSTYAHERDFPAVSATSLLSAHIKFGTLSIREIYHYAQLHMPTPQTFLRELLWHDFFTTVAALAPHVYTGAYKKEFDALEWDTDKDKFEKWKQGITGFPIVDAGMRELAATGYMHNRVRMIVASFLIKDLHMSWQWGERHFAQTLTDYDPAVNNGNWQWVAGTGCDASPWFRIFNPWLQQEKFDAECVYIKQWVPELADLSAKDIHDIEGIARQAGGYPAPMCDHKTEAQETKRRYSKIHK
jgi:deoxyribodipyrimidine photo-lyase